MPRRLGLCASIVLVLAGSWATPAIARQPSAPVPGAQADGSSWDPVASTDGRYVAFLSDAANLLDGDPTADPNGFADVFLVDRLTATIRLVSARPVTGDPADGGSTGVDISGDGRSVVFASEASNLVADDANGTTSDVFVFDSVSGGLRLLSRKGTTGAQGNGPSFSPSISADGSAVSFASDASNLSRNDTNGRIDIFVKDTETDVVDRVSTDSNDKQANGDSGQATISANGGVVAFSSTATNLINGDISKARDVFVKNLTSGKTTIASVRTSGVQVNADSSIDDVSASGRYVVMQSYASLAKNDTNNRGDVYVRDRTAGTTTRVSRTPAAQGNNQSFGGAISDDGSFVVFQTWATNLLPGTDGNGTASDVLGYDAATGALSNVSVDAGGDWANGVSFAAGISGDGLTAVFASRATDVVEGDTNGSDDVFTRVWADDTRASGTTTRWSVPCTT